VALNASEFHFTTRSEAATRDLSHDLRTPLAVIRMQAQLLIRLTKRGAPSGGCERERLLIGLQRIDDAVTKLNSALERIGMDGFDDRRVARDIH
jgi:signal transduction histidine kinase